MYFLTCVFVHKGRKIIFIIFIVIIRSILTSLRFNNMKTVLRLTLKISECYL